MFERGGYGMIALLEHPVDDQVQGIGGVIRIAEPVGVFAVKKLGHHLPRGVHEFTGLHAEVIARSSGAYPKIPVKPIHECIDFFRFGIRCGAVIEKYDVFHSTLRKLQMNRQFKTITLYPVSWKSQSVYWIFQTRFPRSFDACANVASIRILEEI